MRAFERLDLFGKPVLFNFGGYAKSKSRVGAIFTLGLLGFVIWVVYYFGKEIIEKKNPSVTNSESFRENPAEMQINSDTFVVNFGITDKNTWEPFMNESIYTFQAYLYQATRIPQADGSSQLISQRIPLNIEPCTKAHFGELGESFSYFGLSSMYCLSKDQLNLEKELSIHGKFESPSYQNVMVEAFLCDSSTSTIPCGSSDEIDERLGFFQVQFSNTAVDPIDYDNPVTRFRDSFFTSVGSFLGKEVDFWLSPLEMKTDDGWLTASYKTKSFVQYSKVTEFVSTKQDSDPFVTFYLLADGVTRQYTRSYIKVQDVAARVNGIFSFSLILLIIIATPYVRLKFYEALIHDLFDVKMLKDRSKENMKRSKTKKPSLLDGKPEIVVAKQITEATKNGLLTIEEELPQKKPEENHFSENLLSSPRGESEIKAQQQQQNLLKIHQTEEEAKKPEYLLSVEDNNFPTSESPRKNNTFKKGTYGSPTLLEMKPDLTKPTFKTLMGDGDTHDAFEDLLIEMAINQQEQEENEKNNKQIILPSTERAGFVEEGDHKKREEQQDRPDNPPQEDVRIQMRRSASLYLKNSDQIDLSFCEYLRSFVCPTELIKEKMYILNEGIRRINERLDIFNLLKKLREVDKLKILMLEDDQYILFEGLPKPEIIRESTGTRNLKHSIKNAKFIQENIKNELILASYQNLKSQKEGNLIDKKLLKIFDDIFIE